MMKIATLLVVLFAGVSSAGAQTVNSKFDTGTDGFNVGDVRSGSAPGSTFTAPTYNATGGNPGGYISTSDQYDINSFFAPTGFVTALRTSYGGSLSFDIGEQLGVDQGYTTLIIYGNGTSVASTAGVPVGSASFNHYDITLTEGNFGYYNGFNPLGTTPSAADFKAILANASALAFFADLHGGPDVAVLDNVILRQAALGTAVPGPVAGAGIPALLAVGGAFWARRRKIVSA